MPGSKHRRRLPSASSESESDSNIITNGSSENSSGLAYHSAQKDQSCAQTSSSTISSTASDSHVSPSDSHSEDTHTSSAVATSSKRNGKSKIPSLTSNLRIASSTPSSGFSSAVSDTSVHSTTSGTSSPLASGSVFHRLNPADIKYRDEKAKIVRQYIVGKLLGEGSYGKVKEAIDSITKKMVALKICSRKSLRRVPGGEASIEREIGIIEAMSHKNVISVISHFLVDAKQKYYIVFEYMGGGTLTGLIENSPKRKLPLYQARKLFSGLIAGMEHMREHRILHRDLKPDNLLLDINGELKIGDFGVAEVISTSAKDRLRENGGIGSPAFQAPELIVSPNSTPTSGSSRKSKRISTDLIFKSDIWSAGIVLYIMVIGEYPFPIQDGNIMLLFDDIAAGKVVIPDWIDGDCADLILQMLKTNPLERIDLPQIRTHPFFKASYPKSGIVPLHTLPTMWPHQDKSSLSSIIKKMKPLLEREEEQERRSRFSFENGRPSFEGEPTAASSSSSSSTTAPPNSKCAIM